MTEMFGEAWPPMSVPDLAPNDDDDVVMLLVLMNRMRNKILPEISYVLSDIHRRKETQSESLL